MIRTLKTTSKPEKVTKMTRKLFNGSISNGKKKCIFGEPPGTFSFCFDSELFVFVFVFVFFFVFVLLVVVVLGSLFGVDFCCEGGLWVCLLRLYCFFGVEFFVLRRGKGRGNHE